MSQQKTITSQQEEVTGGLLVINLRGMVNTRAPVRTTLEQMKIARRFNATIVPDDKVHRGMLHLSKEHVAWCKLDARTAEKLLKARSEKSTGRRTPESEIKTKDYASVTEVANGLATGKLKLTIDRLDSPFLPTQSSKRWIQAIDRTAVQGGRSPGTQLRIAVTGGKNAVSDHSKGTVDYYGIKTEKSATDSGVQEPTVGVKLLNTAARVLKEAPEWPGCTNTSGVTL